MTKTAVLLSPAIPSGSGCSNGAIRRAARRMGQIYDDAFAPSGLKGTQYSLLSQITRLQGPTMRTLAQELVMDLSALGHTLKPLVRDGFVELNVDADDRRCRRVTLTEKGVKKYQEAREIWTRVRRVFDEIYGAEEAVRLRATLDYIASESFAAAMALKLAAR
ncbi:MULTISPECIES: MarR family winged helix-turn-helix transcriptional regulator [unclassified Pseudomonas]|uniref:MarR family winged helix-turn-helix transcriptional regulator n=1 Tax=unclassified Pseudomonas TaxID=196821 RepID=UPI002AC8ECB7|nr:MULTISPECIES: MarR family winged helix-turn-helix transcriptional regulator [unclassified Pseudomonas]MEB0043258.1 MarR family winged helix-turn-helix transcriptional regulator [Pseudomonas sp. MH10]MEB0122994.1 MarR family winged helix-turn-helix transcriptional regulator [Pseudomonas sp. CCI1.2]WPX64673.1 MarR family winged helix-turn-helix transcriptional regulator [Pseudomonas sp. MH10]